MNRQYVILRVALAAILGLPAIPLAGQSEKLLEIDQMQFFEATVAVVVSGAVPIFTIQVPAGSAKTIYLRNAQIKSTVDATMQMEKNGTAATVTALVSVPLNTTNATPLATVYGPSDVGSGSGLLSPFDLKAGIISPVDLSWSTLSRNSTAVQNFTFRGTAAITGTVTFSIIWGQK